MLNKFVHNLSSLPPNTSHYIKADSGASSHSFCENDKNVLINIKKIHDGPNCKLPDGSLIKPQELGEINGLNELSKEGKKAYIHPMLKNTSLLSIGQLCDDGCTATFDKEKLNVTKNNKIILQGIRNHKDGLWDIPMGIPPSKELKINAIIRKNMAVHKLANYLHACAGSPTLSTFQAAIKKGNFLTWPNIDNINFNKYIPNQIATAKGHMDQERQGLQSTKNDTTPTQHEKTQHILTEIIPFTAKELSYTDQTGQIPFRSTRGHEYVMILYDYDSNAILAKAFKNRQAKELVDTWESLYKQLTKNGHNSKCFILDNECSNEMKAALRKYNLEYQLVQPDIHRRNSAERAVRTFKNHFLSCLATCHKDFPIREWDRLIPQAVITINMLRNARVNPALSAYTYLNGVYNFNKHPMAPFGSKVMIHNKVNSRGSWEYHSDEGWYLGPSLEHYRCFRCFNPETRQEIISDTVEIIEENIPLPAASIDDYLKQSISDILTIFKKPQKTNLPFLKYGDETKNAIVQVAELLHKAIQHPEKIAAKETRVQDLIKEKINAIPPPTNNNKNLDILNELKIKFNKNNKKMESMPCPHKKRAKNKLIEKTNINKIKNNKAPQTNPIIPPPTNYVQLNNFQYHQNNPPPVYMYPNRNVMLPFTPMGAYPLPSLFHIFNDDGKKMSVDQLLVGKDGLKWQRGLDNELGRLSNGIPGRITGTKTINFIKKSEIPSNKKVTYANLVCDFRELKEEQYRIRLTLGGDKLDYFGETASPAANLLETKILVNSVISDTESGARFMSLDIKDFFLQSTLPEKEYLRIHKKYFTEYFLELYDLKDKINADGYVYCEIVKGMYGLKQAAILAYKKLKNILEEAGYIQIEQTTGLWKHKIRKTIFALCVDDFGVKYFSKDDLNHLITTLQKHYVITKDMKGEHYCGLKFDWHYDEKYVDVSMPDYIQKALKKYGHKPPKKPQYAPHIWAAKFYGKKPQQATPTDTTKKLKGKEITTTQSKIGTFLYYGRAVDQTILPALGEISVQQANPTEKTNCELDMLMDYLATYPSAVLRFYAGQMKLSVESDAAYLVLPGAKSRIAGYYVLDNTTNKEKSSPIFVECKAIRHVVCSAAEAETHGLFVNCQNAIIIKNALEGMGHKQGKIQVSTDNTTSTGFVNKTMKEKKSKTWDMRYNWLRDDVVKKIINVVWKKGEDNMADYFTKNHPPSHHKEKRKDYILKGYSVRSFERDIKNILKKSNTY